LLWYLIWNCSIHSRSHDFRKGEKDSSGPQN
jgi:hypothetical protein